MPAPDLWGLLPYRGAPVGDLERGRKESKGGKRPTVSGVLALGSPP